MILYKFLLGLVVGSFVNVLVYRIPRHESWLFGRSKCTDCGQAIRWYDLIPVFSYLILKGKCRNCKNSISVQYPLIELFSGFLFVSFFDQPFILFALEMILVIGVIDLRHYIIPDKILVALGVVGLIYNIWQFGFSTSYFAITILLFLLFFCLWYFSKGQWLGFGDVKFVTVLGLAFGFPASGLIVYISVLLGGIIGAVLLLLRKAHMKTELPFGTMLAMGTFMFIFFQDKIYEIISRI